MAPPPEYDKEPKAPDKSATNLSCEETKALHNLVNDQQRNTDNKSPSTAASTEVENKLIETLDDGQLRALLDEAITYKCPKDREGKSSLFKELLEEVEQDEQASEAAARTLGGGRAASRAHAVTSGRGSRSRRALPHSNSLQDLVAALAAEPPATARRHRAPPAPAPVSTRAIHGGSLPSGVDTSFLLGEEPTRGAGYLATVRCVNPPPLTERRVSTDASCGPELDQLARRSKPAFPMTYTARATLEIGSGAVGSGRAVTTTTASNQVRTRRPRPRPPQPTTGPPMRLFKLHNRLYIPPKWSKKRMFSDVKAKVESNDNEIKDRMSKDFKITKEEINESSIESNAKTELEYVIDDNIDPNQFKLLSALFPKVSCDKPISNGGGNKVSVKQCDTENDHRDKGNVPRGPQLTKDVEVTNKKQEKQPASTPVTILKNEANKKLKRVPNNKQETTATLIHKSQVKQSDSAPVSIIKGEANKQTIIPATEPKIAFKKNIEITAVADTKTTSTRVQKSTTNSATHVVSSKNKDNKIGILSGNGKSKLSADSFVWKTNVSNWYDGLENYSMDAYYYEEPNSYYQDLFQHDIIKTRKQYEQNVCNGDRKYEITVNKMNQKHNTDVCPNVSSNIYSENIVSGEGISNWPDLYSNPTNNPVGIPFKAGLAGRKKEKATAGIKKQNVYKEKHREKGFVPSIKLDHQVYPVATFDNFNNNYDLYDYYDQSRKEYRERVSNYLLPPKLNQINPRNVRKMTIGKPLSSFVEFDNVVTNNNKDADDMENCAKGEVNIAPEVGVITTIIDSQSDFQKELLTSSEGTKLMSEDLEDDDETGNINLSIRSSTPIPEQNVSLVLEASKALCESIKDDDGSENISKIEDISSSAGNEQLKGTVIPVVSQSVHVAINTNEDLCSFSQEVKQSLEVKFTQQPLQQQEDTNINLLNVIIENNDVSCNKEDDVELGFDSEFEDTKLYKEEKLRKNDVSSVNDNVVEILGITSHNRKIDNLSNRCEDSVFSKYHLECKTIRKSEAPFEDDVELADMSSGSQKPECVAHEIGNELTKSADSIDKCQRTSFSKYLAGQETLFQALANSDLVDSEHSLVSSLNSSEKVHNIVKVEHLECNSESIVMKSFGEFHENVPISSYSIQKYSNIFDLAAKYKMLVLAKSSNGPVVLTLPYNLISNDFTTDQLGSHAIEYYNNNSDVDEVQSQATKKLSQKNRNFEKLELKKKSVALEQKKIEIAKKKALKAIMFENSSESRRHDESMSTSTSTVPIKEQVDAAIPFSCITTPEVVASCNTTSSTSQSAVAVDQKPLQLPSSYRAVASLVGEAASPPRAASPPPPALAPSAPAPTNRPLEQPRGAVATSFNGLPLCRPGYGAAAAGTAAQDEYKKPTDENGNSVQGFSSPLSGSSQHKKPRRKKSSKNETVIKSHQIDGYQGNKDLNEVLRFIESAAENTRAGKLGRAKHRDDADDKGGKKRAGTRKDKESKMKRATSMEELSCSRMEDLTDKPSPPARAPRHSDQAKAERRSWGDDARSAATRFFREEPLEVAADADFQTVTKKRKPRRRPDEPAEPAAGDPPRPSPPEPRARRVSAPPSDRSNDSNDDMDSVHSLPADAAGGRGAAPASYADIARTRHNIPDLIESCNYYSEGERGPCNMVAPSVAGGVCAGGGGGAGGGGAATPALADGYPALEPRRKPLAKHAPRARKDRKLDRAECVSAATEAMAGTAGAAGVAAATAGVEAGELGGAEWPCPDVVADRRPAVILLDAAAPRDMDGVTFGFDINETLLGGPGRRPRCDLVLDALEGAPLPLSNGVAEPGAGGGAGAGALVVAGCAALRYMPPVPPPDSTHLHQIIDYVGAAWEDVVRCGAGKVHYFSE